MSKRMDRNGFGCLTIFCLIPGLGLGYLLTFTTLLGMWRSQSWVETPCRIVSSELHEDHPAKGGSIYCVAIVYTYSFADRDYQSDRYDFFTQSSPSARS